MPRDRLATKLYASRFQIYLATMADISRYTNGKDLVAGLKRSFFTFNTIESSILDFETLFSVSRSAGICFSRFERGRVFLWRSI